MFQVSTFSYKRKSLGVHQQILTSYSTLLTGRTTHPKLPVWRSVLLVNHVTQSSDLLHTTSGLKLYPRHYLSWPISTQFISYLSWTMKYPTPTFSSLLETQFSDHIPLHDWFSSQSSCPEYRVLSTPFHGHSWGDRIMLGVSGELYGVVCLHTWSFSWSQLGI